MVSAVYIICSVWYCIVKILAGLNTTLMIQPFRGEQLGEWPNNGKWIIKNPITLWLETLSICQQIQCFLLPMFSAIRYISSEL